MSITTSACADCDTATTVDWHRCPRCLASLCLADGLRWADQARRAARAGDGPRAAALMEAVRGALLHVDQLVALEWSP